MRVFLPIVATFIATAVQADIVVTFRDGAPKDRFTFAATDDCMDRPLEIRIDLSGSHAGLIFDTTDQGQGVEVSQPFELVTGAAVVRAASEVADGDTSLTMALTSLLQRDPLSFTIDVDDTIGAREITVSNAEIAGATVSVTQGDMASSAIFSADAQATVSLPSCAP